MGVAPKGYAELLAKAVDRAEWPASESLVFSVVDGVEGARWARELHARLGPGRRLSEEWVSIDPWVDGRAYNFHRDSFWPDDAGGGVLRALECFGALPGDGVDNVWHVIVDDARVLFEEGTDYTQGEVHVLISAETPERLAWVTAVVTAFLRERGLGEPRRERYVPRHHG